MKKTTAYYRSKALESENKRDFINAIKNYDLAIKNYPKSQLTGELGQRDLASLKANRQSCHYFIESEMKGSKACPRGTIRIRGRCTPEQDVTLADHAEAWWSERRHVVPRKKTKAWDTMYQKWVNYAFK